MYPKSPVPAAGDFSFGTQQDERQGGDAPDHQVGRDDSGESSESACLNLTESGDPREDSAQILIALGDKPVGIAKCGVSLETDGRNRIEVARC